MDAFNDGLQPRPRRSLCLPFTRTAPWYVQGCVCEIWMLLSYPTTSTLTVLEHAAGFRPPADSSPLGSAEWIVMIIQKSQTYCDFITQGQPSGIFHLTFFRCFFACRGVRSWFPRESATIRKSAGIAGSQGSKYNLRIVFKSRQKRLPSGGLMLRRGYINCKPVVAV